MYNSQLLCTIITDDALEQTIEHIQQKYTLAINRIYVLQNTELPSQLIVTYNISANAPVAKHIRLPTTVVAHRKKDSNTIYTINALNLLIAQKNGGVANRHYQLDWSELRNRFLIGTVNNQLKGIHTRLYRIVHVNQSNENVVNTSPYYEGHPPA